MNPSPSIPTRLSVVVPAFNESRRLGKTLAALRDYAARQLHALEVIVVDDGSRDTTSDVVRRFDPGPMKLRLLVNDTNRGKGYSVRRGMLEAEGDAVLMSDADSSTPIEEVEKLLPWMDRGFDVVIGSRDMDDSVLDPPQPPLRRLEGWGFRVVRRWVMLPSIRDTQCGFKLFSRAAARDVFEHEQTDGFVFDCEALGLAEHYGHRIKEVGVLWRNDPVSTVRPVRDALRMFGGLLRIRRELKRLKLNRRDAETQRGKKI